MKRKAHDLSKNDAFEWFEVERDFIRQSERSESYPEEKIRVVELNNVQKLGELVGKVFVELITNKPDAVVALPTGKTPEYFIAYLQRLKSRSALPDTSNVRFVQLDEFFPLQQAHQKSFKAYIDRYYVPLLDLREENILRLNVNDIGIVGEKGPENVFPGCKIPPQAEQSAEQRAALRQVFDFCGAFERRIASVGGIDFFLGGIGPDGHIAFNCAGSAASSRTRIVTLNYPSSAAAAGDLGGMTFARHCTAVTVGLATICEARRVAIMAAGEAKASVVARAVECTAYVEQATPPPTAGVANADEAAADYDTTATASDAGHRGNAERHAQLGGSYDDCGTHCVPIVEYDARRSVPASVLAAHKGARFYVTRGAAKLLVARRAADVRRLVHEARASHGANRAATLRALCNEPRVADVLIERSCALGRPIASLVRADFVAPPSAKVAAAAAATHAHRSVLYTALAEALSGGGGIDGGGGGGDDDEDLFVAFRDAVEQRLTAHLRAHSERLLHALRGDDACVMHTSPHHDDIMLSYFALLHELVTGTSASNYVAYFTSGFTSVTDAYIERTLTYACGAARDTATLRATVAQHENAVLHCNAHDLIEAYTRRCASFASDAEHERARDELEHCLLLNHLARDNPPLSRKGAQAASTVAAAPSVESVADDVRALLNYFARKSPGAVDTPRVQRAKGFMRESECDRMLVKLGVPSARVSHLRTAFYTGEYFTPPPSREEDAAPFAARLAELRPAVITVAFDPEGTGPDTHYKTMQVVAEALRMCERSSTGSDAYRPLVVGYRNVWHKFSFTEANSLRLCTRIDLRTVHDEFLRCFSTQRDAQFPSHAYDGPFSGLVKLLQRAQWRALRVALPNAAAAAGVADESDVHGLLLLHLMETDEFLRSCEALERVTE